MAKLLITQHWESDESVIATGKTDSVKRKLSSTVKLVEKSNDKPTLKYCPIQSSKHSSQRRSLNMQPKTANVKLIKDHKDIFVEPSHVKLSALLYEITERTNQLAQPRVRAVDEKKFQTRLTAVEIPKASQRVIKLSQPRLTYQQPSKPIGYVSPGALQAVASRRIIELSRPKKKRKVKVKRRKKLYGSKSRFYTKHAKKKQSHENGRNYRRTKRRKITREKRCLPKTSDSDRTIIVVDLKSKNKSKSVS
ncbi:uncharacterized protein LOC143175155 [Nomia melanderi]|uniref:uncharacterized protein LOC143175155 n=1 Tax=Nomia melanderi TaxID=2448451 RepID=UPI003FCE4FBB